MRALRTGCALLALALAQAAAGAVFSVTPVRIYMVPKDRAVAVTVANEGDTPVVLQADVYRWSQRPDGEDELVPSEDLILAPPILKLAPRAKQVVRLARLSPPDPQRQLTYRLILREVPEAGPAKGVDVPVALALSMPVFITPPVARHDTACRVERAPGLELVCANTGSAYVQVREALLRQNGEAVARFDGGAYILPGAAKRLALQPLAPLGSGALELVVTFDDGATRRFPVPPA